MTKKTFNFIGLDARKKSHEQPGYDIGVEITIDGLQNDVDHHGEKGNLPSATLQMYIVTIAKTIEEILEISEGKFDLPEFTKLSLLLQKLENNEEITLATVRPDSDSISAMAVYKSFQEGRKINKEIIKIIDKLDREGPSSIKNDPDTKKHKDIITVIAGISFDGSKTLGERVSLVQYALEGSLDEAIIKHYIDKKNLEYEDAKQHNTITIIEENKLVLVEGKGRYGMNIGYENGRTVIAKNPEMPLLENGKPNGETYIKYTIAKLNETIPTDIDAICKELNELEPGRGDRKTIIGSPQNISSKLSTEEVIAIVKKHL